MIGHLSIKGLDLSLLLVDWVPSHLHLWLKLDFRYGQGFVLLLELSGLFLVIRKLNLELLVDLLQVYLFWLTQRLQLFLKVGFVLLQEIQLSG